MITLVPFPFTEKEMRKRLNSEQYAMMWKNKIIVGAFGEDFRGMYFVPFNGTYRFRIGDGFRETGITEVYDIEGPENDN